MMDLPGFTVNGRIPVDISYGCLYQAWTYVALLTHKVYIIISYFLQTSRNIIDLK